MNIVHGDIEVGEVFTTRLGFQIDRPIVRYTTINAESQHLPWLLVFHGLSANTDVVSWWSRFGWEEVSARFRVVCLNSLGSSHGTSPVGVPDDGTLAWVAIEDMTDLMVLALKKLGITKLKAALGCSLGGQQALDLSLRYPSLSEKVISVCGSPLPLAQRVYNRAYLDLLVRAIRSGEAAVIRQSLAHSRYLFRLLCTSVLGLGVLEKTLDASGSIEEKVTAYYLSDALRYPDIFSPASFWNLMSAMNRFSLNLPEKNHSSVGASKLHLVGISGDNFCSQNGVEEVYRSMKERGYAVSYSEFETRLGHEAWVTEGHAFYRYIRSEMF